MKITTSTAMQQYYKARHVKMTRGKMNTHKLIDSQKNAMQARDFIQGFTRKHRTQKESNFLAWLLK